MALSIGAPAILILTRTGKTAQSVSHLRPNLPIIACTESPEVVRSMAMLHGVYPVTIALDDDKDPDATLARAFKAAMEAGLLQENQQVVVIADTLPNQGPIHSVHIRKVS